MFKFKRKSIVSQIIVLFFIVNAISLTFFTFYLYQQDKRINMRYIEESLQEISQEKANVLSANLDHIKAESQNLAFIAREYALSEESLKQPLASEYQRDDRGVLGRRLDLSESENRKLGLSNVYLPQNVPLTPQIEQEIITTEKLDPLFRQILDRNKYIQWAYFTTQSGMMRLYPYVDNSAYEADHDQLSDVFYATANKQNNPSRKTVWTPPYYDYLLTGWMITCSTPIYDGGELIGVLSLDLRLGTLQEDFLADFRLADTGFAFLIDSSGNIVYHPAMIEAGSRRGELLERNIFDEELSLAQIAVINSMLEGSTGVGRYKASDGTHLISYSQIPDQGWTLGIEVNQDDFLIGNKIQTSGIYAFLIFSIFLFSALSILIYRQYSRPFKQLTSQAQMVSEGNFDNRAIISNFQEIEILSGAFNAMSTKLKNYTESLIRRTNQVETVFNSIGGLLMILSPDYEIKMINRKGYYRFCKLDKDLTGTHCYRSIARQGTPCNGCGLEQAMLSGKPVHMQIGSGNEIFSNAYYPIASEDGKIEEIIVYSQNITNRILMEKELSQAEKLAGIGQLSSAIAHELKNPLAIMKGASYLLRSLTGNNENPSISSNIDVIDSSIQNAENVVFNLLDFTSRSRKVHEVVDVGKIIEQILLLEKRNITKFSIETYIDLTPAPFVINCQADAIKHVLLNLIANAIQAMPNGGRLTIKCRYLPSADDKVEVSVSDEGKGIPFNLQSEIFKPFFTTKEAGDGTGLGLWITKLTVEKLSGEIKMHSIPGKGTTFTVVLPASQKKES